MGRPPKEIRTRAEAFAAHPLVFVAPPGHALLRGGPHAVGALAPYPIIAREHGSGTRTAMMGFFAEHQFEPRIAMEMSSNETIKQAVMAGLGLSFLSLHTMGLELRSGLLQLLDIRNALTIGKVFDAIDLGNDACKRLGIEEPRIAVCGLNPHAGEHGLFGSEDIDEIAPAIAAARSAGIDATGPHPADTVFFQAVRRFRHDAIVVMYHDQGHAPMKLLAFDTGVNVTLGLPIIRTSVDHGTAFDIAWTGRAFTDSLTHALAYAERLAG